MSPRKLYVNILLKLLLETESSKNSNRKMLVFCYCLFCLIAGVEVNLNFWKITDFKCFIFQMDYWIFLWWNINWGEVECLTNHLPIRLEDILIRQQGGCPAHFAVDVRNYLENSFSSKWIGRGRTYGFRFSFMRKN